MHNITFRLENGANVTVQANCGETLLQAAQRAGVFIDAPCGGSGVCGKCRVKILSGTVNTEGHDGLHLACRTEPLSDVTLFIPSIGGIRTAGIHLPEITPDNGFEAISVRLAQPSLDDTMPDNERLANAIGGKARLTYHALKKLPQTLREGDFSVFGRRKGEHFTVYDFAPDGLSVPMCALAVDIGTTTVCALLTELTSGRILAKASLGNAQIRFGADVINRIIEQGRPNGVQRLRDAMIEETLIPLIDAVCKEAKIAESRIFRLSIAANTTMNHLLLGLFADPIRTEPYIPCFFRLEGLRAKDLSLPVHPDAEILVAPNIGSYVGGDITSGVFASELWKDEALSLFVDLGTNGEIVLGNSEFSVACACSAGPAFEGGDISCGMRATDGAIDRCTIDKETMEPTFSVLGGIRPVGICGSGLIDIISELFSCGIIDARGDFIREGERILRDEHGMGRYMLTENVFIDRVDIDNFIRAKAAVYSAIDTLLSAMDMDETALERVYIAGGIGSSINAENAIHLGMLPDLPKETFRYIGNSALSGAYAMAVSDDAAQKIDEISRAMTYMELSSHPGYMDNFIAACFLPHTDASRFGGA